MDRRYPPDLQRILDAVDNARNRLRQEIERTRELLRQVEQQIQAEGTTQ